jgi:hypothetical protein
VFGYPARKAAVVALSATRAWLKEKGSQSSLSQIVFNTFLSSDSDIYLSLFPRFFPLLPSIARAASLVQQAEAVLVVAGSGS